MYQSVIKESEQSSQKLIPIPIGNKISIYKSNNRPTNGWEKLEPSGHARQKTDTTYNISLNNPLKVTYKPHFLNF